MYDFDGETYEPEHDQKRLNAQLVRVWNIIQDKQWHTLAELKEKAAPGTEAAMSARLRDFRKERFGGYSIERRRVGGGLWEYRLA